MLLTSLHQCRPLVQAVHVLSCLCDDACKRSLAICHKSRALCPVSRLHWWGQDDNMLIEFHLSQTKGLCRAQTWMDCLTDRDANHYAISPPQRVFVDRKYSRVASKFSDSFRLGCGFRVIFTDDFRPYSKVILSGYLGI